MIELVEVWKGEDKGSKDGWTLADVSLGLPAGHRIALIGPDGGKNTAVLRMLSGVEEPDKGAVRRSGKPCWPLDFNGVFEGRATFRQNAAFISQVYGVDPDEAAHIAIGLSGVRPVKGKAMNGYEIQEKKALLLGLTLSLQFDWYFIDEKLPKGPEAMSAGIEAVIRDRMSRASVVWATTKPESLDGFCDAALLLDRGTLTFYTEFSEALDVFRRSNEIKADKDNDRKSRKAGRRRRSARRSGEVDTENAR